MATNPYLDATYERKPDDKHPKGHPSTPTKVREEVVTFSPAPPPANENDLRRMQAANRMTTAYLNTQVGNYDIFSLAPSAPIPAPKYTPVDDDPFYVPNYFEAFETSESQINDNDQPQVELEFDPPLTHYAELRGGLPIGYVWIPPSSPEPMPRAMTPEQERIKFVTPSKSETASTLREPRKRKAVESETPSRKRRVVEIVTPKRKKRDASVEYQKRFRSPLSCSLSPPPSGLLTPEPRV